MHQNFIPFFFKSQSFLRLSIALYVYITFFFAPIPSLPPFIYHILGIHPSKNIRAVLIFGLEWMRPPWTMVFKYLFGPLPLILSDVHPETKLLAYVLSPCLIFWGTIMPFPQRPHHLMTPSCQQRTWVQILPARPTPVVYFVAVVLLTGCIRSGVSFDLRFLFWLHRLPRGVWAPQQGRHRGPSDRAGSSALERHATPASSPSPFNVTPLCTHLWPHRAFLAALASSLALVFGLLVSVASRWEAGLQGGSFRLWLLGLQRPGSKAAVHSPSCPWACGVPPSLLLWQLGPLSLSHGKPTPPLKKKSNRCVLYPTQHVEA